MSEKLTKKRAAPLSIRFSEQELDELDRCAAASGLSRHAFIRAATLKARMSRRAGLDKKLAVQFLAAAARLQDQLHDVALAGGSDALTLEQARGELAEIREALLKALGRK